MDEDSSYSSSSTRQEPRLHISRPLDIVSPFSATSSERLPARCKLIETRLIINLREWQIIMDLNIISRRVSILDFVVCDLFYSEDSISSFGKAKRTRYHHFNCLWTR